MTSASISIYNILAFHKVDRDLYTALLLAMGGDDPEVARNVVALFIWLEQIGVHVVHFTCSISDRCVIVRLLTEAEAILDCIRLDTSARAHDHAYRSIPLLASLVEEPLDQKFFYRNQDRMMRGVAKVLDGVGRVIFDDHLHGLFAEYEAAAYDDDVQVAGEEEEDELLPSPTMPQELARPYGSYAAATHEDKRSMLIAFFDGQPLNQSDIFEYFTGRWGDCIETVVTQPTVTKGVTRINGRIIFNSDSYVNIMLNGKLCVKFWIKGTLLWAQRYE